MSLRIKKGDLVTVIAGSVEKGQGRTGRVLAIFPSKGTAIVEGINMVKKHQKARSQTEPGGIIEKEAPVAMSKLMLAETGGKGRAGRFAVKTDPKGNKVRVLKIKDETKEITV